MTRYKQIERRLAKLEQILDKRTQRAEPALYIQVDLEAQQQFPPEELPLLQSAKAARHEGRFHSLEEHEVMERFSRLRDVVGRRYGFASYGWVIRRDIDRLVWNEFFPPEEIGRFTWTYRRSGPRSRILRLCRRFSPPSVRDNSHRLKVKRWPTL